MYVCSNESNMYSVHIQYLRKQTFLGSSPARLCAGWPAFFFRVLENCQRADPTLEADAPFSRHYHQPQSKFLCMYMYMYVHVCIYARRYMYLPSQPYIVCLIMNTQCMCKSGTVKVHVLDSNVPCICAFLQFKCRRVFSAYIYTCMFRFLTETC